MYVWNISLVQPAQPIRRVNADGVMDNSSVSLQLRQIARRGFWQHVSGKLRAVFSIGIGDDTSNDYLGNWSLPVGIGIVVIMLSLGALAISLGRFCYLRWKGEYPETGRVGFALFFISIVSLTQEWRWFQIQSTITMTALLMAANKVSFWISINYHPSHSLVV